MTTAIVEWQLLLVFGIGYLLGIFGALLIIGTALWYKGDVE